MPATVAVGASERERGNSWSPRTARTRRSGTVAHNGCPSRKRRQAPAGIRVSRSYPPKPHPQGSSSLDGSRPIKAPEIEPPGARGCSSGPLSQWLRDRSADHPPIVSMPQRANPLIPRPFPKKRPHQPSWPGAVSDSPHPVGGEGVGSSAPMSAGCGRAMKPGGRILRGSSWRSMDGLRLLAARQWSGPLAVPCPSRVPGSNVRDG